MYKVLKAATQFAGRSPADLITISPCGVTATHAGTTRSTSKWCTISGIDECVSVRADALAKALKHFTPASAVTLQMQQGELQATDGLQTVGLRFIADDTPASDICTVTSVAPIYLAHLQTWLRSVAFALAKSDVRYYLRDVYITVGAKLGTVDVVASNGYVLAVHTVTSPALCALVRMRTEAGGMVNISHKVIKVIMAWKPTNHGDNAVVLSCSRASICFAFGDDTVCSASTDYIYYDYQRLLVQKLTHTNARIATDFAKTIASLAKTREVVEVTAQDDKLRVLCDGKELLACDATVGAEAHTVHLDSAYLYDALTAMKAVGFADAVVSISDTHCIHLSVGGFQFVQMGRRV